MKKFFYLIFILSISLSCNKRPAYTLPPDKTTSKNNDSIRADSIEREKLFNLRGDTVFADICYGMDEIQTTKRELAFQNKFKDTNGFIFDNLHFMPIYDMNREITKALPEQLKQYSSNFDFYPYKSDVSWGNHYFHGKLYQVGWQSYDMENNNEKEIKQKIEHLINIFKNKYGNPSQENLNILNDFGSKIYGNRYPVAGFLAIWESSNREIRIDIDEERSKDYQLESEINNGPYRYSISINFININIKEKVIEYVDSLKAESIKKFKDKEKEDSINYLNSL